MKRLFYTALSLISFGLLLTCSNGTDDGGEVTSSLFLPALKLQDGGGQVTLELTICGNTYTVVYSGGEEQDVTVFCRPGEYQVGVTFYLDKDGERIFLAKLSDRLTINGSAVTIDASYETAAYDDDDDGVANWDEYKEGTLSKVEDEDEDDVAADMTDDIDSEVEDDVDAVGRFVLVGEAEKTVVDRSTGLIWQQEYVEDKTWQEAIDHCAALIYAGKDDWRLPDKDELAGLLDNRQNSCPYSDFPDMPCDWFWSSSSDAYDADYAWYVDFGYGFVYYDNKDYDYAARCVRP